MPESPKVEGHDVLREAWLLKVAEALRPIFEEMGYRLPKFRVSCGFTGASSRAIGVCWAAEASGDKTHEIFIHPNQAEPMEVAAVLAHELTHAAVGIKEGHGKKFGAVARALGLDGKLTSTRPGDIFKTRWDRLASKIGKYPHAALGACSGLVSSAPKKQGTRLVKVECPDCGYTMRVTRKWIEQAIPMCPMADYGRYREDMDIED